MASAIPPAVFAPHRDPVEVLRTLMTGRASRKLSAGGQPCAAQHQVEQGDRAYFVERLVPVAALGRLDARRAARGALARRDGIVSRLEPRPDPPIAALGEARPTRVSV